MTDREREILILNAICGVKNDTANEVNTMHDFELKRAAERALSDIAKTAERVGKVGMWCFFCGASGVKIDSCDCGFSESFSCGRAGRLVCADCRAAHRIVASHLQTMFSLPFVARVNSRRLQRWREFSRAVLALYPEDADAGTRPLFGEIAQVDEWDQDTFRRDLLRCFAKAKFLDFQTLARNLKQQQDESLIRAAIRAGLR